MCNNWKKATLLGILLWVLIFVEITILIFLPWLKDHPMAVKIIHLPILAVLVFLCARAYFKVVAPSAKEGFLLSIYFLIIVTILDAVITVPLFIKQSYATYGEAYAAFYGDIMMLVGYLVLILVGTLVGGWCAKYGCSYSCCGNKPVLARPAKEIVVEPTSVNTAKVSLKKAAVKKAPAKKAPKTKAKKAKKGKRK